MAIEIVDLPINSMVMFHSFLYVYHIDVFMGKSNKKSEFAKDDVDVLNGKPSTWGMSFGMCYFRVFLERQGTSCLSLGKPVGKMWYAPLLNGISIEDCDPIDYWMDYSNTH